MKSGLGAGLPIQLTSQRRSTRCFGRNIGGSGFAGFDYVAQLGRHAMIWPSSPAVKTTCSWSKKRKLRTNSEP